MGRLSSKSNVEIQASGGGGEPDISVIVPAFNAEPWISETLRSVLDQTIDPVSYEIIVVDNGSQDRTREVAAEALRMAPARVTLSSEAKRGPAHARNHGLRLARGSWIQFLDADDLLHGDKLARQLPFAEACGADVGSIYSAWQNLEQRMQASWTKGLSILPDLDQTAVATLVRSFISDAGFVHLGAQLFRRAALADVGGFKAIGIIEDVDLYLRLAMAGWSLHTAFRRTRYFVTGATRAEAFRREALLLLRMGWCGTQLWSSRGRVRIMLSIGDCHLS